MSDPTSIYSPSTSQTSAASQPMPETQQEASVKNPLWNYFKKKGMNEATCETCKKTLKTGASGTTSSLLKHLKLHKPIFEKYTTEKQKTQEEKVRKREVPPPQKKDQPTIHEILGHSTKWPSDNKEQKKVNNIISNFIIQGLHPYSVVEEPGFKSLIAAAFPKYTLPCRTTFSRTIIPNLYETERTKMRSVLVEDLSTVQSISFTTDGWKSRSGHPYLSLTCHYIDEEFNYKHYTLSNTLFEESATGDNIYDCLNNEIIEWGISTATTNRQVPIYFVTDGGRNIVNAIKRSPWNHRECFAHKLQLVVQGAVDDDSAAQEMLQKARCIVGHYHKSMAATTRLMKIQKQLGDSQPKNVIQMVDTRWNSEFSMLDRLLFLKNPISTELATSQHSIEPLSAEEWDLAAGYVQALKPISTITDIMSAETYPTTSMIIPVLHEIESSLNIIINSNPEPNSTVNKKKVNFSRHILQQFKTRFVQYKNDNILQLATVLDPRFKCILLETNLIEKKIATLADRIHKKSDENTTTTVGTPEASNPQSTMWAAFEAAESKVKPSHYNPGAKEIRRYLEDPLIAKTVNPYDWWKANKGKYPLLAKLAAAYLSIPATQASSERLFSTAGNIITARRESLLPKHAEQLLFLHNNK